MSFKHAKPALIRGLIAERTDPVLFALSYDYVGDLSETVALMWPRPPSGATPGPGHNQPPPSLTEVVETLRRGGKAGMAGRLGHWLDALDETGRWALLKLITGALRIGVSARLAKTAVAALGALEPDAIEEVWHGIEPPYQALFAWAEGRGPKPEGSDPAPFRPPMLAHPLEEADIAAITPDAFAAEWKWDGIRVQAVAGRRADGTHAARLYSRSGDDISSAFPDVVETLTFEAAIDGELLIVRDGAVQSFNALQQRLNRKIADPKLIAAHPAEIRAYDLLSDAHGDLRTQPFALRRERLERFIADARPKRMSLSQLVNFQNFEDLAAARADPAATGIGRDAEAVEGLMLKRKDAVYVPGRPKGQWYKWKKEPHIIDAVLMYAQRGHGKRSSFYSDFTFGVWNAAGVLVPVGKAYFGFTDAELAELDRFVRKNTINRFGPVREVTQSLVLEIAFEGLARSTRHKSGVAMRFPRISRIRWDKRADEADQLTTLERLL